MTCERTCVKRLYVQKALYFLQLGSSDFVRISFAYGKHSYSKFFKKKKLVPLKASNFNYSICTSHSSFENINFWLIIMIIDVVKLESWATSTFFQKHIERSYACQLKDLHLCENFRPEKKKAIDHSSNWTMTMILQNCKITTL